MGSRVEMQQRLIGKIVRPCQDAQRSGLAGALLAFQNRNEIEFASRPADAPNRCNQDLATDAPIEGCIVGAKVRYKPLVKTRMPVPLQPSR